MRKSLTFLEMDLIPLSNATRLEADVDNDVDYFTNLF